MSLNVGITANVDYLTITTKGADRVAEMTDLVYLAMEGPNGQKPMLSPWFFQGYRGYRSAHAAVGTRNSGDGVAQISGELAHELYYKLFNLADNCSRIDLAVTRVLKKPDGLVAHRAYNDLSEQKKHKTTIIQSNRGGATFYLGTRSSRRYSRIYDKGAEQGQPHGTIWRYEVEYKKPASKAIYVAIMNASSARDFILAEVYSYFTSKGIDPGYTVRNPERAIEVPRNLTSDDKMLKWLERQVSPAITKLVRAGRASDVQKALGLDSLGFDWDYRLGEEDF